MTLYEINDKIARILYAGDGSFVDGETGEVMDESALDALDMERHDKIENILRFRKNMNAEAEALEKEADSLMARAKTLKNKAAWAEGYLARHMDPGEKFDGVAGTVRWRKSKAVAIDVPIERLPQQYIRVSLAPKKAEIGKALKSGAEIPGTRLEERIRIQIR